MIGHYIGMTHLFTYISCLFTFYSGLVEDYGLVNFVPLSVNSKEMMLNVKNNIDKANGYCFGVKERTSMESLMSMLPVCFVKFFLSFC